MTSGLIFLHQRHFNSLDLCYMGGFLDDAAGGPGGAVLPLRQVGQGHGGVDLLPVRLVFSLHLLRSSDATAATDDQHNMHTKEQNRAWGVRGQVQLVMNEKRILSGLQGKRKSTHLSHLLDLWSVVSESTTGRKKVNFATFFGVSEALLKSRSTQEVCVCVCFCVRSCMCTLCPAQTCVALFSLFSQMLDKKDFLQEAVKKQGD